MNSLSYADALEYYQRVLGFQVAWRWGEPLRLAGVCRDRVEVNLSESPETSLGIPKVYFPIIGVDAYYRQVSLAGAKVVTPLAQRPYGMRDFRVVDPSGNELSFGEASSS